MVLPSRKESLTLTRLRQVLDYCPETGAFTWVKALSTKGLVGQRAGFINAEGYRIIGIDKVIHRAARLAHLWMTGEWSPLIIDHIDGDRSNDRWSNLREATSAQNNANAQVRKGRALPKGVLLRRNGEGFEARISINKTIKSLGFFPTIEEAEASYNEAAKKAYGAFAKPSRPSAIADSRRDNRI